MSTRLGMMAVKQRRSVEKILQNFGSSPLEQARLISLVMKDYGLSQGEVANVVKRKQPWVAKRLALLSQPPAIIRAVERGKVSASAGFLIAGMSKEEQEVYERRPELLLRLKVNDISATGNRCEGCGTVFRMITRNREAKFCPSCGAPRL